MVQHRIDGFEHAAAVGFVVPLGVHKGRKRQPLALALGPCVKFGGVVRYFLQVRDARYFGCFLGSVGENDGGFFLR